MSKLLLLLLFALVQNMEKDGCRIYDAKRLQILMGNVIAFNVYEQMDSTLDFLNYMVIFGRL